MTQLRTLIPLATPRGTGFAHFLEDAGQEHESLFGVFLDATGEFWWFRQRDVRLRANKTMGRHTEPAVPAWEAK